MTYDLFEVSDVEEAEVGEEPIPNISERQLMSKLPVVKVDKYNKLAF